MLFRLIVDPLSDQASHSKVLHNVGANHEANVPPAWRIVADNQTYAL